MIKGKVVYHYTDGDDEITEGQAYYARPGQTPEIFAGSEVMEFSPTAELAKTIEVTGHGTYIVRFRGGKVIEFSSHPDVAGMMMQLGFMPQM